MIKVLGEMYNSRGSMSIPLQGNLPHLCIINNQKETT